MIPSSLGCYDVNISKVAFMEDPSCLLSLGSSSISVFVNLPLPKKYSQLKDTERGKTRVLGNLQPGRKSFTHQGMLDACCCLSKHHRHAIREAGMPASDSCSRKTSIYLFIIHFFWLHP